MNRWIEDYLCQFVLGHQNNWSALLPMAEFAHNSWRHENTKHTPHELIIGINPTASIRTPEDSVPAAQERLLMLNESQSDAQKALQRHIKPIKPSKTFAPGDKVWLDACNLKIRTPSRKLSPWRYGPFKVLQRISPIAYCIELPQTMKIHNVFHIDLLIPHCQTKAYRETYCQPPPELIDGEEEYEIKEIIDQHTDKQRQKKQYLVSWVGYPASENSWVDESDLHAPELLEEYHLSKA